MLPDADALIEYVNERLGKEKLYLFLDEIQNVKDWNEACRTLRLYNCSVFISGSNSKLLSKEFTKELSGRFISFRVRPFVYKESIEYAKQNGKPYSITDYLIWGGFHASLAHDDKDAKKRYSVAEEKSYNREFAAFTNIDNTVKKILITNDDIDYSTSTVYHYKLKDFLMMEEL